MNADVKAYTDIASVFIELVKVLGMDGIVYAALLILGTFVSIQLLGSLIKIGSDFILTRETKAQDKHKREMAEEDRKIAKDAQVLNSRMMEALLQNQATYMQLIENLSISISYSKFEIITQALLGHQNNFANDIKIFILNWQEAKFYDRDSKIIKELRARFDGAIAERLKPFVFKDRGFFDSISPICHAELDSFFNDFKQLISEGDQKILDSLAIQQPLELSPDKILEIREFVMGPQGIDAVTSKLLKILSNEYKEMLRESKEIDFLKIDR